MRSEQELKDLLVRLRRVYSVGTKPNYIQNALNAGFPQENLPKVVNSLKEFIDILEWVLGNSNSQIDSVLNEGLPVIEKWLRDQGIIKDE
jgi:hypothetical protein